VSRMRNISLCSRTSTTIEGAHIVATAVDPESGVIFTLTVDDLDQERALVDIWRIGKDENVSNTTYPAIFTNIFESRIRIMILTILFHFIAGHSHVRDDRDGKAVSSDHLL
jgi:hypothetical protein